jgi:hypothetical protein
LTVAIEKIRSATKNTEAENKKKRKEANEAIPRKNTLLLGQGKKTKQKEKEMGAIPTSEPVLQYFDIAKDPDFIKV